MRAQCRLLLLSAAAARPPCSLSPLSSFHCALLVSNTLHCLFHIDLLPACLLPSLPPSLFCVASAYWHALYATPPNLAPPLASPLGNAAAKRSAARPLLALHRTACPSTAVMPQQDTTQGGEEGGVPQQPDAGRRWRQRGSGEPQARLLPCPRALAASHTSTVRRPWAAEGPWRATCCSNVVPPSPLHCALLHA